MRNLLRDLKLILFLAVLWWGSGAMAGVGIRAYVGIDWILPCASLNLLFGMIALRVVLGDRQARERLLGENDQEMPMNLGLILLIGMPIGLIFAGILWVVGGFLLSQ